MADKIVTIQLTIPEAAVNAGAIEGFAKKYGWSEKIVKLDANGMPELDEEDKAIMLDHPLTAEEFGVQLVKGDIMSKYKSLFIETAKKTAAAQAEEAVKTLLGE